MESYFVLDERGEPRAEHNIDVWTRWFEHADRSVARTVVTPEVTVLTTFRGVDESTPPGSTELPCLFETRVFGGVLDGTEGHHRTRAEALAAHAELADWCRAGSAPGFGLRAEMID
jgi:hypothetical protein